MVEKIILSEDLLKELYNLSNITFEDVILISSFFENKTLHEIYKKLNEIECSDKFPSSCICLNVRDFLDKKLKETIVEQFKNWREIFRALFHMNDIGLDEYRNRYGYGYLFDD